MPSVIAESSEARTFQVTLQGFSISSELVQQLAKHATVMENFYKVLQKLTLAGVNDESQYKLVMEGIQKRQTWFVRRKAVATALIEACTGKKIENPEEPKKKGKKSKDADPNTK